ERSEREQVLTEREELEPALAHERGAVDDPEIRDAVTPGAKSVGELEGDQIVTRSRERHEKKGSAHARKDDNRPLPSGASGAIDGPSVRRDRRGGGALRCRGGHGPRPEGAHSALARRRPRLDGLGARGLRRAPRRGRPGPAGRPDLARETKGPGDAPL